MTDPNAKERPYDTLISAQENKAMFDYIAPFYDTTNRLLSLGLDGWWRKRAVARLAPRSGGKYLDVGCGTGDMALEVVRQAPGSGIVGIDPSEGMLEKGRLKVEAKGFTSAITLERGDVLDLQYADGSFDGAITAFCIRNVTNRRRGLEEIRRVLRPGAQLVILELTEPGGPIMKPLFRVYGRVIMPLVTKVMSSVSAYRYLTDSMAAFAQPHVFSDLMVQAGFQDVHFHHLTGGIITVFIGRA